MSRASLAVGFPPSSVSTWEKRMASLKVFPKVTQRNLKIFFVFGEEVEFFAIRKLTIIVRKSSTTTYYYDPTSDTFICQNIFDTCHFCRRSRSIHLDCHVVFSGPRQQHSSLPKLPQPNKQLPVSLESLRTKGHEQ